MHAHADVRAPARTNIRPSVHPSGRPSTRTRALARMCVHKVINTYIVSFYNNANLVQYMIILLLLSLTLSINILYVMRAARVDPAAGGVVTVRGPLPRSPPSIIHYYNLTITITITVTITITITITITVTVTVTITITITITITARVACRPQRGALDLTSAKHIRLNKDIL